MIYPTVFRAISIHFTFKIKQNIHQYNKQEIKMSQQSSRNQSGLETFRNSGIDPNKGHWYSKNHKIVRNLSFLWLIISILLILVLGMSNAEISARYQLYTTPPGIFFSIWGIIYLSMITVNAVNLYYNFWSYQVHKYIAIVNLLQLLWTIVFNIGTDTPVFISCCLLIIIIPYGLKLWIQLGNKANYNNKFVTISRNVYAFFLGWIIAASNLSLGILFVYLGGISKENQAYIFWIMTPLCAVGGTALNYSMEGRRGLRCCWALWISVIWALSGAGINTRACLSGIGGKC